MYEVAALLTVVQEVGGPVPLPADPPIGGLIWTVVVPAALLIGSSLGTYLLYKRFAGEGGR